MFNPFSNQLVAAPHSIYRRLRSDTPIFWSPELQAWVLTRMADVKAVLEDPACVAIRTADTLSELANRARKDYSSLIDFLDAVLFFKVGADHQRDRRTLASVMNRIKLTQMEKEADAMAHDLLARAFEKRCFDAIEAFAAPFPQMIMARILGLPDEDVAILDILLCDLTRVFDPTSLASYDRINADLTRAIDLIAARIRHVRSVSDVSNLKAIYDASAGEGEAKLRRAAATTVFVYRVGSETTIGFLGGLIQALCSRRDLAAELREGRRSIDATVAELLRLESNVQRSGRWATQDIKVNGFEIKQGSRIMLLLGSANRDEIYFERPDEISKESRARDVVFGAGEHFCLGASLARMEGRVALKALIERSSIEYDGDPTWYGGRTVRRCVNLPVRICR